MLNEVLQLLPPGYKFLPTDVELIKYYLQPKIVNHHIIAGPIYDVDVYQNSPDNLYAMYKHEGEQHTYFFTIRNRKYPKGERPDRGVRGFGFWKATGIDHPINDNGTIIGFKKTLVFYRGNPKGGDKTNWIMQEYTINIENIESTSTTPTSKLNNWVICKIYEHKRGDATGNTKKRKRENENLKGENMEEVIPTQHSSLSTLSIPSATSPPPPPSTPPTHVATSLPLPLLSNSEMSSDDIDMTNFVQSLENELFDIDQLLDS